MLIIVESIIQEIIARIKETGSADARFLEATLRAHSKGLPAGTPRFSKKRLMPYCLSVKRDDPATWASWVGDEATERALFQALRVKPRRTASGVATITVLTKPWKCGSNCLYCPNDLRMPKSYLSDEPACQRAERNFFDPYLQVARRLRTLEEMGHVTDKVELIVLGGTWSDYPEGYRTWFVEELFRALNEGGRPEEVERIERSYRRAGLPATREDAIARVAHAQRMVDEGSLSYNAAMARLYEEDAAWSEASRRQSAGFEELERQQSANEDAEHRVVGLVVETRPDAVDADSLRAMRRLGCTKVQMGVQSLDPEVLKANRRGIGPERIASAFALARAFGFKIHAHLMVNLYGSSAEADKAEYRRFVEDPLYRPDEIKLYPCALVAGTGLMERYEDGSWRPYGEDELVDVLVEDVFATPDFIRISRMIRDISSHDIVAGNKKVNLRQLVERKAAGDPRTVREIRFREISTEDADVGELSLEDVVYETSMSREHFLQWTTPEGRIAGFLRLSLPDQEWARRHADELPTGPGQAMIREVHVYGKVAGLHTVGSGAQHHGLGKSLVERACRIASEAGYGSVNVISSVGTRGYYRRLGFADAGLYQRREL